MKSKCDDVASIGKKHSCSRLISINVVRLRFHAQNGKIDRGFLRANFIEEEEMNPLLYSDAVFVFDGSLFLSSLLHIDVCHRRFFIHSI